MTPRVAVLFTAVAVLFTAVAALAFGQAASSGLDRASFDASVRPQDDLFAYVNARWAIGTPMPADRVSYGPFVELADRTEADLRVLIEEAANGRRRSVTSRSATPDSRLTPRAERARDSRLIRERSEPATGDSQPTTSD
jgi:hypothetical protein